MYDMNALRRLMLALSGQGAQAYLTPDATPEQPDVQPQDVQPDGQGNALRAMFGPQESLRALEQNIPALREQTPQIPQVNSDEQAPPPAAPLMQQMKAIRKNSPSTSEQQAYAQVADQYRPERDRADMIPMNTVRNNDTGEIMYLGPQGASETPYGSTPRPPGGAQSVAMQGGPIRAVGMGNGTTVELSPEVAPAKVNLDYSRAPVDAMGAKAYYSKDQPGVAYVVDGSGRPTAKVYLGYDMQGSMALNKYNLDQQKTKADIAHTEAATQQLSAPEYQLTPEGDVFEKKSGTITSAAAQPGQTQRSMQKAAYQEGLKELAKDEQASVQLNNVEQAYRRWQELNAKVTTGRLSGMVNPILSLSNPERQEMEKLQSFLAMNNFRPGQGSMSNFERTLIQKGGPNLSNDEEANADIVKAGLASIQNQRDRDNFRQIYLQSHGNLMGSDQAWQQYLQSNPAIVQDPRTGRVMDNPNRVSWQQFFSGGTQNQPAQPMNTVRPNTGAQAALVMPKSKAQLVVGKVYQTARGPARWNGAAFEQ